MTGGVGVGTIDLTGCDGVARKRRRVEGRKGTKDGIFAASNDSTAAAAAQDDDGDDDVVISKAKGVEEILREREALARARGSLIDLS
jgi:hypothetical protein